MIQNHVPKAEGGDYANARERLEKNPRDFRSGMFTDFATAETVTAALIHAHQKEYDAWLKNPNATRKLALHGSQKV
jgi:Bacterial CdiA-CT RNAse A domain